MSEYYRIDSQGNYVPPTAKNKKKSGYFSTAVRYVRVGQSLFKTDFDHKLVTESVQQHKYGRFAMASYHYANANKTQEVLQTMPETMGYVLDTKLSNTEHSVFFNKDKGETIIAFRGTANLLDIVTDAHILVGQELKTQRFQESEELYHKVASKYGTDSIVVTGHSLGSAVSVHIAEKFDVEGHHFNPGISPRQAFDKTSRHNRKSQIMYRTHVDPVSVGAEIPNTKRRVVHVHNHPSYNAHQLENFYDANNEEVRSHNHPSYRDNIVVKKEKIHTTVIRHKDKFKKVYDAWENSQNIEAYMDGLNRKKSLAAKLSGALPKAVGGIRRKQEPRSYQNDVSRNLNPFFGFIPDPDFQWTDDDVITPLRRAGKAMRSHERRKQDKRSAVQDRLMHKHNRKGTSAHIYHQVPNLTTSGTRRAPMEVQGG